MVSVTVDSRREIVSLGRDESGAAAAALRIRADSIEGGVLRKNPGRAFDAVADSYFAACESAPGARPNRVRTTRTHLARLRAYWRDVPVDGITIEHVRTFIDDATGRYSPNYASALYSTFRSVLGHAQDHGLIAALPVPAKSRIRPRNRRPPNHLSVDDANRVIAALPTPYEAMAELALLTGLRVGEIAALEARDLDRERAVLHVRGTLAHDGSVGPPKTRNGDRVVALSPRAFAILNERVPTGGRVFPVPSLAMCGFIIRQTLIALGLHRPGLGWHAFRHAHQAMLEAAGVSIREAAARMGHGANFIQTAAYGWTAEAGDAGDIDAVRDRLTQLDPRRS
jgi:integrase